MAAVHGVILGSGGSPYIEATGGTITDVTVGAAQWRVHKFTASGTFTVIRIGAVYNDLESLVEGGGGGGGTSVGSAGASGGGGGAVPKTATAQAVVQAYPVTVGAGGAPAANGEDSVFNGTTSKGGGAGGWYGNPTTIQGQPGGSGGGAGQGSGGFPAYGGTATDGGNVGGNCIIPLGKETGGGGGGGGAGGPGADAYGAISPFNGGNGGDGTNTSISGTEETLGAGGGGAGCNASSDSGTGTGEPGVGGSVSTGGDGAQHSIKAATVPRDNSGSGGGGGNGSFWAASAGADGVVYIRYRIG